MKKIIALILSLVIVLGIAGCGGETRKTISRDKKTKIVFWHTWNDEALGADIEKYNQTNEDNIEVEYKVVATDYRQAVDLAVMSNNVPDVITAIGISQMNELARKGSIIPLEEYITDELRNQYLEGFECKVNTPEIKNVTYGVADASYTRMLVYNKDIFKKFGIVDENGEAKAPETFEEMMEYTRLITEKGNGDIYGMAFPFGTADMMDIIARGIVFPSAGRSSFDYETQRYDFSIFTPVVDEFRKAYADGAFAPGSATMNTDQVAVKFVSGQVGMTFVTSGFATRFGVLDDLKYDFEMGACDIPYYGEKIYKHTISSPGPKCIMEGSKNKEAAWKFLNWFLTERGLSETSRIQNADIIFHKETRENEEKYFQKSPTSDLFKIDTNEYMLENMAPPTPLDMKVEGKTSTVLYTDIVLSNLNTKEVIDDITVRHNKALDETIAAGTANIEACVFENGVNPFLLEK